MSNFLAALVFTLLCVPGLVRSQTPIGPNTWTGQGTSAVGPSAFTVLPASAVPGSSVVNISQWDRAASMTNTTAGGCYNTSAWQVGGSLALAQANAKYIYFTITNDAATELQVTQLHILSQVSATGPQSVQLTYSIGAGPDILFGATLPTLHTASPEPFTFTGNMCLAPLQTATFRLYGWGGTGGAGTLRVNNGTSITAVFAAGITATSATNTSPVCAGNPLGFNGTFTGGVLGYTYSWAGPGGFSSILLSPVIPSPTPAASGTYTFTVTDALTCSAAVDATTTATVTAAPPPSTGIPDVCEGQTTTLSNTDPGGSWSTSDAAVADVGTATGIVSGISAGTANITYSIGTSCIDITVVTVLPSPAAITGAGTVCTGQTIPLADATAGGTWVSGSPGIADVTIATGVVTGITAGTATITYTLLSGCFATWEVTVYTFPSPITGPDNVCSGSTITLDDVSPGGTWSSLSVPTASVGAATGIVTGGTPGNTTIVYTLPGGCAVTHAVTVNPLPAAITGTAVVCVNAITNLSNTTPSGVWSSSSPLVATVNAFGVVFGVAAGTATISYTLGTGCYQTRVVTVNAIPSPITGPSGVCIGSSVTLNDATPGGTWISSNTAVATIGNLTGVVASVSLGTTTITYRFTTTGCFVTRTEIVNPLPGTIAGASTVCPGTTITLTDLPGGGTWSSFPTTIATVNVATGDVTGVSAGTATITYTLPTGCTATTVVTVNPAPPATVTALGDTMMCPGDFVTLTANTGSGLTYQWHIDGGPIPGAAVSIYVAGATGAYQIQVTNTFGCSTFSVPMHVAVNAVTATITVPGGSLSGCSATGVLLDANVGTGLSYQWVQDGASIAGATASSYTALTPGDYTVVVSNTTGCSATSLPVTINIFPSPGSGVAVGGPTTFCQGASLLLTAVSGSGFTYQWHNSAGPIAGATNMTYSVTASGSYYANVTNSFGCTTSSITTPVTVNPLPDVAIAAGGPKIFCAGGSVTLLASVAAGYNYQWYKSGTAITGATNSSYIATLTGGYRVRITNSATGCTDMTHADTVVTNVNTPVIIPLTPASFCWGGNAHLSTSVSSAGAGIGYQWFLNDAAITGATTPTWHAGVPGTYKCVITIPGSCITTTTTIVVTQKPLPDPIVSFNGTTFSTATFYTNYQWYKNLAMIAGANAASTVATGNGSYKVFVTDTNGCQSASTTYVLTTWHGTTGIAETEAIGIKIYPNPARELLHIAASQPVHAIMRSMDGRVVANEYNVTDINMHHLANGVYVITFLDGDDHVIQTDKVVKTAD